MRDSDVIIEFVQQGTYVRVSAMHAPTMTEVSIVGPASAGERVLEHNVLKKLTYVLEKAQKTQPPTRGFSV